VWRRATDGFVFSSSPLSRTADGFFPPPTDASFPPPVVIFNVIVDLPFPPSYLEKALASFFLSVLFFL